MSKKTGLGRGLGALIRDAGIDDGDQIKFVDIAEIMPREDQPRKSFDDASLKELASSIEDHGILQPLIVRESSEGYQIIAGERRYRAAILAKIDQIPIIVKSVSDQTVQELSIIENIQRQDLNPIEEANAYRQLIDDFDLTQEQLSQKVGKSRSHISNIMRLLNLEPEIKKYLISGEITTSQGRSLLSIKDPKKRMEYLKKLLEKSINIRDIERRSKKKFTQKDIFIRDMEDRLTESLATKVRLIPGKRGGKIEISYFNNDDLERIFDYFKGE
ncbi:MAG: ParB/RepB/Spo0J family partition protein [Tissierellia bacterium]|nr:ParB/RepB/Spo0J family partition protein [Tissierellia bacterium]